MCWFAWFGCVTGGTLSYQVKSLSSSLLIDLWFTVFMAKTVSPFMLGFFSCGKGFVFLLVVFFTFFSHPVFSLEGIVREVCVFVC